MLAHNFAAEGYKGKGIYMLLKRFLETPPMEHKWSLIVDCPYTPTDVSKGVDAVQ